MSVNNINGIAPHVTPTGDASHQAIPSNKIAQAAQILQQDASTHKNEASLKDRASPKGLKQLLEDGIQVLKEAIAEKRKLITKERVLVAALIAAVIAVSIIGLGSGIAVVWAVAAKLHVMAVSAVIFASGLLASLFGTMALLLAAVTPLISATINKADKIDNEKEQIKQLEQHIDSAQKHPQANKDPIIQHLTGYEADPQISSTIQQRNEENKRKEQEWLIQFAQVVAEKKQELDLQKRHQKQSVIAKIKPTLQKLQQKSVENIWNPIRKVKFVDMRSQLAQALRRLSLAVQP